MCSSCGVMVATPTDFDEQVFCSQCQVSIAENLDAMADEAASHEQAHEAGRTLMKIAFAFIVVVLLVALCSSFYERF